MFRTLQECYQVRYKPFCRLVRPLLRMLYARYLDGYRMTPKERYIDFIRAYPDVLQIISLKELASYLHITPVYLSRIRKEVHRL